MPNWVQGLWYWILELLRILLALAIYFAPVVYRRWRRLVYTPLYFSVYFFTQLKLSVIDEYLGSSSFPPLTEDEDESETLRKKAILKSISSAVLDTAILPGCVAFVWLLWLNSTEFTIALVFLILIQLFRFLTSVLTIHRYTVDKPRHRGWLVVFYFLVLIIITLAMLRLQSWASPLLTTRNYSQLVWNIADVFWNLVVMGLLFALVTAAITTMLLSRTIRRGNLNERRSQTTTQTDVSRPPKSENQN